MHIHWHKKVGGTNAINYYECRCGKRKTIKYMTGGWTPDDNAWLRGDKKEWWAKYTPEAPKKPSDC